MDIKIVCEIVFVMLFMSFVYLLGLYCFIYCEFFIIMYCIDLVKLCVMVLELLEVFELLVVYEFICMVDFIGFGDYIESG